MGLYTLFKSTKNQQYYFRLTDNRGNIILTSEGYTTKSSAINGIESVRFNSTNQDNYETKRTTDRRIYFVLKASNGRIVGKSPFYSNQNNLQGEILKVIINAPISKLGGGNDSGPRRN